MTIKIITDSTSDLPEATAQAYGITVIPAFVNIDGQSYLDGVDLTRPQFYERLQTAKTPPSTAVPGVSAFVEAYQKAAAEGAREILSIHVSSTWSGMCDTARMGAEAFTSAVGSAAKTVIHVFDTRTVTMGLGMMATRAAQAAADGLGAGQIVELLQARLKKVHVIAVLETLEYLRRSGRATYLQYSIASALHIKPIIRVHDGAVALEKRLTTRSALERVAEIAAGLGALEGLALVHTGAPEKVARLREQVLPLLPAGQPDLPVVDVGPLIGVHVGPGAAGVAVMACP